MNSETKRIGAAQSWWRWRWELLSGEAHARSSINRIADELFLEGLDRLTYLGALPGWLREALETLKAIHVETFGDSYAATTHDFSRT